MLTHLADVGRGPVGKDALLRACSWGDYLESHARRVYAPALSPDITAAAALADRIQRGDLPAEFALRDVQRKQWSGLAEREEIKAALELLVDLDWLREQTESTAGRPRTRYTINPKIQGAKQ